MMRKLNNWFGIDQNNVTNRYLGDKTIQGHKGIATNIKFKFKIP